MCLIKIFILIKTLTSSASKDILYMVYATCSGGICWSLYAPQVLKEACIVHT